MANAEIDEITGLSIPVNFIYIAIANSNKMLELYTQYESGLLSKLELMDELVLLKKSTVRSIEDAQRALMK